MKKLGFLMFLLALALILGGNALAQNVGDNSVYFTTYFANNVAAAPDATLRIVNDGDTFSSTNDGHLWASIYVFDDSQELTECCSCFISADGLLSESVKRDLTQAPITHITPTRGVIKVISSSTESDVNTNFAANTPTAGLRGWATHIQSVSNKNPFGAAPYSQTETALADSNLGASEQGMLELLCKFDKLLSGHPCNCTPEDLDF
jgi:hypothetical protein